MKSRRSEDVSPEYAAKLVELQEETELAETVQGIVESREPAFERLGAELRTLRLENHFTPLFMARIGARR